jgi:hypothetical protein
MMWSITATCTVKNNNGTVTTQIPAFLLNGISTEAEAKQVALEIVNPTRDDAEYDICAVQLQ